MDAPLNIVLVEDNDALRDAVAELLSAAGHRVTAMDCAEALVEDAGAYPVDVAIIDLQLPGESGLSLIRRLRHGQPNLGIIAMTALSSVGNRIAGYEHGADAYLVKPVDPRELLAATVQAGRRSAATRPAQAGLQLDVGALRVEGPAGQVPVSEREAQLLASFVRAAGQQLETWQVFQALGTPEGSTEKNRTMVAIARLRSKLTRAGAPEDCLRAIRQSGYRLCVPVRLA
ncbi:MAG: response regulator transcription factor [Gammaproteobacteria bacterium]